MECVNHWSNEQTMLEFADQVLIPYVKATKESLSVTKIQDAGIKICFIPAGCTGPLQPWPWTSLLMMHLNKS